MIDPLSQSGLELTWYLHFLIRGLSVMSTKTKKSEGQKAAAKPVIRHENNPFVENMVVPIKGQRVKLSRMGRDDNVLVNQHTGEMQGTHVATYRKVDSEQFVKLFTQNIGMIFDLKTAGIKAFNVLIWVLQEKSIDKDLVPLDKLVLEDFLAENKERKLQMSQSTFWRGLAELEGAQIIAKHLRQGWYFINPNFCFNGDRIAFTQVIERREPKAEDQQELPLDE